ncbi:hypothetical protein Pcinc_023074 [Petrolisthes cinctipes]|uniref:Uncharacterized protein n=1 Tax=Petrolisthes cinctipes TaxID=88211 RepID=A0AAE1FF21_PETCI|nr:hypothetical protein Pcinc_023074 [Petrolisthes cinctipes]
MKMCVMDSNRMTGLLLLMFVSLSTEQGFGGGGGNIALEGLQHHFEAFDRLPSASVANLGPASVVNLGPFSAASAANLGPASVVNLGPFSAANLGPASSVIHLAPKKPGEDGYIGGEDAEFPGVGALISADPHHPRNISLPVISFGLANLPWLQTTTRKPAIRGTPIRFQ